jgi:hypothetical protein
METFSTYHRTGLSPFSNAGDMWWSGTHDALIILWYIQSPLCMSLPRTQVFGNNAEHVGKILEVVYI